MDKSERIYIAPKRGRLPWRYEERAQFSTKQKLHLLSVLLIACAGLSWWLYEVLK